MNPSSIIEIDLIVSRKDNQVETRHESCCAIFIIRLPSPDVILEVSVSKSDPNPAITSLFYLHDFDSPNRARTYI